MPTYDYKCKACGHALEAFQSMSAGALRKCPKCGKNSLERQIGTGAAILFKGGGFYQTDYRSESYKKAADADKPQTAPAKPEAAPASTDKAAASTSSSSTESKAATPPAPAKAPEPKPVARKDAKRRASK